MLVVGGGGMGARHLNKLAMMPGVELVGLADPDLATQGTVTAIGLPHYTSLADALGNGRVDGICIASPTPTHHGLALEALEAGVHVLVEKPIATTLAEADDMIEAARRSGCVLAVGHVERHNPVVAELRRLVVDGTLGEISSLVARRVGGVPPRGVATDVVVDLAVHDIDVMSFLQDAEPVLIGAHGSRTFQRVHSDSAEILMRVGAASGFIQANWVTPTKVRTLTVTGSHGVAEANYVTQELRLFETAWIEDSEDFAAFVEAFGRPRELDIPVPRAEPLWRELTAFVDDVRAGNLERSVTGQQARVALSVALDASAALDRVSPPALVASVGRPDRAEA
jgi:predicted dehydrogenase